MNMMIKQSIVFLLMLMLTGCLSPVKTQQPNVYIIDKIPPAMITKRTRPFTLLVMLPETAPAYDSTEMAYSISPYQITYFSHTQWAETPGQMLQPLIVRTLLNTHHFRAVVTAPFIGRYDYILSTQIVELKQNFMFRPALLELTMRAQITRTSDNQLVGNQQFIVREPLFQCGPYGGVLAANRAVAEVLGELAVFSVRSI